MTSLPNIDPRAFRPGEYVGYSLGVWLIRRVTSHEWRAFKRDAPDQCRCIYAPTLRELSASLARYRVSVVA